MSNESVGFFELAPGGKKGNYLSGMLLARQFYAAHELPIARAACEKAAEDQHFDYTAEQFDDWAVAEGFMPKPVRAAVGIESDGLARMREKLRTRMNRVARQGDRRKFGGQAAIAACECVSLSGWNFCPKPEPSVPL
jgi:hypothetical protein